MVDAAASGGGERVTDARPTQFQQRVYAAVQDIPAGKVATYADIARAVGVKSPQAVGQALKDNPYSPLMQREQSSRAHESTAFVVPCHRIVASDGRIGGFFGEVDGPSIQRKIDLLASEGVVVVDGRVQEFGTKRHLVE